LTLIEDDFKINEVPGRRGRWTGPEGEVSGGGGRTGTQHTLRDKHAHLAVFTARDDAAGLERSGGGGRVRRRSEREEELSDRGGQRLGAGAAFGREILRGEWRPPEVKHGGQVEV